MRRPEPVHRAIDLPALRTAVLEARPGRRVRRIRVEVSPDHVFHKNLPKGWCAFATKDPPLVAGETEGFVAGWF